MNETERLKEALKALREADAGRGASDFAETRLRAAFREHHARKARRWWASPWKWAAVAAAFAVVTIGAVRLVRPDAVQAPPAANTPRPEIAAAREPVPEAAPPPVVAQRPVRRPARRPARESRPPAPAVETGVEEFVAIPYAPPFTRFDQGQVVRVRVPRQSLRSLGFPVNGGRMFERVPADLLMGEDGVPRAIRIVSERR